MRATRRRRAAGAIAGALLCLGATAGAIGAGGCSTSFDVEGRETPVHVWIESPGPAAAPRTVDVAVVVADRTVVDGPVRFPAGSTRVAVPPVYLRAGEWPVTVRAPDGRVLARGAAGVAHATWILVTVQGGGATIRVFDREPGTFD
jgi:hypothetical protein